MQRIAEGQTAVCIATGPSLTLDQIEAARQKGFLLFGCNLIYQIVPDLLVLYNVSPLFWAHYWEQGLSDYGAQKWTTNKEAADQFGLNWIAEKNRKGLSTDSTYVHHGHGSGYTLVNLASLMGATRIVLLGYDCRYAKNYDGKAQKIGSTPRHYFGEYPAFMQHWPSVQVKGGVHVELVELYRSIKEQGLVELVNCTPGSAIDCVPFTDIEDM